MMAITGFQQDVIGFIVLIIGALFFVGVMASLSAYDRGFASAKENYSNLIDGWRESVEALDSDKTRLEEELADFRSAARREELARGLAQCLANGGLFCPHCKSDDADHISFGEFLQDDHDDARAIQDGRCERCAGTWLCVFTMTDVTAGTEGEGA